MQTDSRISKETASQEKSDQISPTPTFWSLKKKRFVFAIILVFAAIITGLGLGFGLKKSTASGTSEKPLLTMKKLGERCDPNKIGECEAGLNCNSSSQKCEKPPLIIKKVGESCLLPSDCAVGLFCNATKICTTKTAAAAALELALKAVKVAQANIVTAQTGGDAGLMAAASMDLQVSIIKLSAAQMFYNSMLQPK